MKLPASLNETLSRQHRAGLVQVRRAVELALCGHDHHLPRLAEIRDLAGSGAEGPLKVRLYVPLNAGSKGPALVYFHGGGFVLGDIETHHAMIVRLSASSGVRILSCDYRLAPEAGYPAQLDDAVALVHWVVAQADSLGIDSAALALGGDSAGGWLAIAATAAVNADRPGAILAQVLFYPLMHVDDEVWASSLVQDSRFLGRLAVAYIRAQLAAETPSMSETAGPTTPPTLLVSGGILDPTRPDMLDYGERLRAAGVEVVVESYESQIHGFGNLTHVSAVARQALDECGVVMREMILRASRGSAV